MTEEMNNIAFEPFIQIKGQNDKYRDNAIVNLSFEFAVKSIAFVEILETSKKFVIARQLIRFATSVGANIREAQNAESKPDFIHKMKIAAKELEETEYWLLLCAHCPGYPDPSELMEMVEPIRRILTKIIATTKANLKT